MKERLGSRSKGYGFIDLVSSSPNPHAGDVPLEAEAEAVETAAVVLAVRLLPPLKYGCRSACVALILCSGS